MDGTNFSIGGTLSVMRKHGNQAKWKNKNPKDIITPHHKDKILSL